MEEDMVYRYTEKVIKQIVKKDDEYTRKMIKEYVRTKYPNEKVRIDFYDEETIDKIINLGINALNSEKTVYMSLTKKQYKEYLNLKYKKCLHCGNDTPLYCEKCQQELITKNAELQLEIEKLQEEIMENDLKVIGAEEYIKASMGEIIENYYTANEYCVPKQVVRDKIQELENEQKQLLKGMKGQDRYDLKQEYMYKINVLEELLGE